MLSLVLVVSWLEPASAQTTGVTTGAIAGTVTDQTGAALGGVAVALSGSSLMGTHAAVTDAEGRYRVPMVPTGDYALSFGLAGFADARREQVRVGVGFVAVIDVQLAIAGVDEYVAVEYPSPLIDRQSTALATMFDARQLSHLPNARSLGAILAATPAVQLSVFEVGGSGGGPGLFGAYGTVGSNRPTVEGIHVTGILGTGLTLNYGSFAEVSVGTAAHSAEWPVPGVQMQFIVKSGGNQYRGTLYADVASRNWQSFNIDPNGVDRGGGGLSRREANRLWRSYDFNADVGGYVVKDRLWWYGSVRDQDVSARQVNFPVRPLQTRSTNYTAKGTYRISDRHRLVGFAHVGWNRQPYRLDPFGATGGLNTATAINQSEASTAKQNALGWIWKAEWNATLTPHMFAEAAVGQFGADRPEEPNGAGPRFEDVDTLVVSGGNRSWQTSLRRTQVHALLSYVTNGRLGHHTFKVGGRLMQTVGIEIWRQGYFGDVLHILRNDEPIDVILFQAPSRSESGLWSPDAYVTDSWQLTNRLTLNLGIRLDRYRIFLPDQTHPTGRFTDEVQHFLRVDNLITWNGVAPRVGAIFQPTRDGRTLLKVQYGQYWLAPGLDTGFNANPNASVWWRRFAWSDDNGSGVWEPGEEGILRDSRGGQALESIDPALKLPQVKEFVGFLERELTGGFGVRSGVVWRGERQQFQRQNVNQPFSAFTVPVNLPDPGPDGALGTSDDGLEVPAYELAPEFVGLPQVHEVRNVPGADSAYWTWDLAVTRRLRGRWSLTAGVAHTWSRDQRSGYFGQSVRANTYPVTPNDLINTTAGGQHEFRTWSAKAFATYEVPWWGLRVTPFLRHQAGQPFGRTFSTNRLNYGTVRILAEPVGTRRMNHVTLLDLRAEKTFARGNGRSIGVFVDVFNVLNASPAQNVNWSSGPSFLAPLTIVPPRLARLGTTLEW